jgi:hypothetical protein
VEHIESIKEFGGWLNRYRHRSQACNCEMTFSVYLPPAAATAKVPAVYWLSGLTCTDDNFRVKAGRTTLRGGTGAGAGHPRHQPARCGCAGRAGTLRSRPGCGLLRQRHPSAVGEPITRCMTT